MWAQWPGRSTDRMPVSDTGDAGSIPARAALTPGGVGCMIGNT